ncbi:hypothetical protein Cphy_2528 [Lachnoclostridium phytofermentans ISDg]|uniref:Uncharacterized protein n=2 Tax=Lachnoclostridium phytofermentans TaxID=66219 RepID=A9KMD5_LACP7|nr:hypothetical protein Cphy_2528 [Lachnoclostridium phytofermentans ISDg]
MLAKSPSGALSPYYYKGGYFHGIHYGSYFDDMDALFTMMEKEEHFILNSPQMRRILIDLYETNLSKPALEKMIHHIEQISPRIIKLAITSDKKSLNSIRKAIKKASILGSGQLYLCTDMEEGKTWLVSDGIL